MGSIHLRLHRMQHRPLRERRRHEEVLRASGKQKGDSRHHQSPCHCPPARQTPEHPHGSASGSAGLDEGCGQYAGFTSFSALALAAFSFTAQSVHLLLLHLFIITPPLFHPPRPLPGCLFSQTPKRPSASGRFFGHDPH
jgi:hypothetical protein